MLQTPEKVAPYISELASGVTLVTGGCGNGAMCSDEIGRIGAKLASTGTWCSDILDRQHTAIKWRKKKKNIL